VDAGWQRQAESSELADGVEAHTRAIGKLTLAAATHHVKIAGVVGWVLNPRVKYFIQHGKSHDVSEWRFVWIKCQDIAGS
jgi:hypothetical protein